MTGTLLTPPSISALTNEPERLVKGVRAWRNPNNGFVGVLLHYTADSAGPQEEARRAGMDSEAYKREHDLSWDSFAGKPAYPDFNKGHVFEFQPDDKWTYWRGWDFGYHRPSCVWVAVHGGLWVLGEVVGEDMTLQRFVEDVALPYQRSVFGETPPKFMDAADIAGKQVSDKSEYTSLAILSNYGIFPLTKKTEINEGLTLIRQKLIEPGGFAVHPRCRILIEGFKGGYRYGEGTPANPNPLFPLKDGFYEHPMDALRYVAVQTFTVLTPRPEPKEEPEPPGVAAFLAKQRRQGTDELFGAYGV